MAVKKYLTPAQVIAAMRKDGKDAQKIRRVEGVMNGTVAVHSVAHRKKIKIPPSKSKFYSVHIKNKRSAIFISGSVDGKNASGILANVLSSSVGSGSASASRSSSRRSRGSSRKRSSRRRSRRSSKSKRRKSSKSKSKRRKSKPKSKRRKSRSRRRSSRRR